MRRGFTLIELLVVITILAILAGAAMPYVQSYVEESRLAKAKTDLEEIARALTVYETREGEYTQGDVAILTGRYLNKSPIDPWGKAYRVATDEGIVVSCGPDRGYKTDDDLFYPYQPPLALVQVKWVDKNNSGAVDTQNVADELHLLFSRKLRISTSDILDNQVTELLDGATRNLGDCFGICTDGAITASITAVVNDIATDDPVRMVASRTVILKVKTGTQNTFIVGSSTIQVMRDHRTLIDMKDPQPNFCISDQPVVILPQ